MLRVREKRRQEEAKKAAMDAEKELKRRQMWLKRDQKVCLCIYTIIF